MPLLKKKFENENFFLSLVSHQDQKKGEKRRGEKKKEKREGKKRKKERKKEWEGGRNVIICS